MPESDDRLTEQRYWDDYWAGVELPLARVHRPGQLYINEILDVFDRHLPRDPSLTAIEIGGTPGAYLAYVHRTFGYGVHCLDYSERGCAATRENFGLLGIPGVVHRADVFTDDLELPSFDVVYSLGLIEHFTDLTGVVERHVRLVRPGGWLLLGVPDFLGINGWFLRRLGPRVLAQHQLETMDLENWDSFERRFQLTTLFKGYVGGFEPSIFLRREDETQANLVPYTIARALTRLLHTHFRPLRRLNASWLSGYAMAVYRVP
jgi:SAM-dependent methyltransferase